MLHGVAVVASVAPAVAEDADEANQSSLKQPEIPAPKPADGARESDAREAMCLMIELAAIASNLPLEFFARVIWQESRFRADAIGPMTRSGQRAQGIAQFMPGTASERGLLDPFNPVQALPKSAEFLAELRDQFGNLGLAAAAYNAGPRRVQEWLAGTGPMPQETRSYVLAITGSTVEDWSKAQKGGRTPERIPTSSCRELMALLKQAPNPFVAGLEQRITLSAAKVVGRAARRRLLPRQGARDVCPRHEAARRRDRRSGPEPALLGDAQPRHARVLPGADRRRHAARRGQSLQPHPQGRRGVLRIEEQGRAGVTEIVARMSAAQSGAGVPACEIPGLRCAPSGLRDLLHSRPEPSLA